MSDQWQWHVKSLYMCTNTQGITECPYLCHIKAQTGEHWKGRSPALYERGAQDKLSIPVCIIFLLTLRGFAVSHLSCSLREIGIKGFILSGVWDIWMGPPFILISGLRSIFIFMGNEGMGETGFWSNKGEKENRIFPALFLRWIQRGLLRPPGEIAAGVKPKLCLCREDPKNSLVLRRDSKSPFGICGKSVLSAVHDADWGCVSVCAVFVQYDAAQLFLTLWNLLKKQIRKPELVRMVTGMNLCPLSCVVSSASWRIPFAGNCPKLNF